MKRLITYLLMAVSSHVFSQQDPQYSQYMFNRVLINPAYIGSKDVPSFTLLAGKQWVNVDGAPQTNNLSFSAPIRSNKMGVGAHVVQENIGPKKWWSAHADYCYRIKLTKGVLSFGISAGAVAYHFNSNRLNLFDKGEPVLSDNSVTKAQRFDVAAGLYYYTRTFYVGVSATHLTAPQLFEAKTSTGETLKFYDLSRHIFLTLGKGFLINEDVLFNPSIMIKSVMGKNVNVDVNACFLIKNKVTLGVSVRSSYNLVALVQYQINDKFRIGYSYDYGLKGISKLSSGSHEIALNFDLNNRKSKITTTRLL